MEEARFDGDVRLLKIRVVQEFLVQIVAHRAGGIYGYHQVITHINIIIVIQC
jgi:hypothetical protein